MKYRLVILDFDGTLADSGRWFFETLNALAPHHQFRRVSEREAEALRGLGNREIVRALGVSRWRIPFIAAEMRKRAAADADRIKLFDGVEEMIAALKASRATVAVVSSNAEANVRRILGPEASDGLLIDCGAGLFGKAKRIRRVMARVGVTGEETIAIGDEQRDIEAAKTAGAASGAVLWGYATEELLRGCEPTLAFERPEEIARALIDICIQKKARQHGSTSN